MMDKLCKDCRWVDDPKDPHTCRFKREFSPVDGSPIYHRVDREREKRFSFDDQTKCGEDGQNFRPAPNAPFDIDPISKRSIKHKKYNHPPAPLPAPEDRYVQVHSYSLWDRFKFWLWSKL